MKKRVCLFAVIVAVLVTSIPVFAAAEVLTAAEAAMQVAVAEVVSMLEEDREPGVLLVFMEDDTSPDEAHALFNELGILNDLEDREVCRYCSYDDDFGNKLWFELVVPEDQMQDLLVSLNLKN